MRYVDDCMHLTCRSCAHIAPSVSTRMVSLMISSLSGEHVDLSMIMGSLVCDWLVFQKRPTCITWILVWTPWSVVLRGWRLYALIVCRRDHGKSCQWKTSQALRKGHPLPLGGPRWSLGFVLTDHWLTHAWPRLSAVQPGDSYQRHLRQDPLRLF